MGAISLKLPDDVLEASRRCADTLHLSRAAYIRRAVERMNRQTQALVRARRLAEASKKVQKESMRVNREFEAFERDPDA
jgi:predicted transcriptional regulator